jgi:transposase-like protein
MILQECKIANMVAAASPLSMTDGQREVLETLVRSRASEFRQVQRAQVLLLAADGVSNVEIAERCEVSRPTVLAWRKQFETNGLTKFGRVAKGRGRKVSIPAEKIAEIVELTLHHKPEGQTHWSCRSMAKRVGVSPATVQRIWSARGLKPHRVDTFKISNDPRFEEKLIDVVGLYLNPPDKAVVLATDEKSQIQALDRTQPSLPMKKGRAGTMSRLSAPRPSTVATSTPPSATWCPRTRRRARTRSLNAPRTQAARSLRVYCLGVRNLSTCLRHPLAVFTELFRLAGRVG